MLVVGSTRYERWQLAAEDDVLGCWFDIPDSLTFVVDAEPPGALICAE
jgi:hypothetical protein